MAFRLKSVKVAPTTEFDFQVGTNSGDVNMLANGVLFGYIDNLTGRLHLCHNTPEERAKLPGLTFDARGRLAIAE